MERVIIKGKDDERSKVWFNLLMLLGKLDMYPLMTYEYRVYPVSPLTDHYKEFYRSRHGYK